ncbi:hypothetical protein [Salinisphaera orenii]|uniref:hypothetical protein n=1 Tax=Salinisphaera orenii TaxID=856731 RepID=UPI00319E14E8
MLSRGILRLSADANVLENSIVQTAASAGEAIAASVIFTLPALMVFDYGSDCALFPDRADRRCGRCCCTPTASGCRTRPIPVRRRRPRPISW